MDESSLRDVVVVGASAGGLDALTRLCAGLPADFPAAVFIAQHIAPNAQSMLAGLLARSSKMTVVAPTDGDSLQYNRIYVSVPDHHLLVRPGQILLRRGPKESRSRPSVNALFRSAAVAYGARVIGVVLTGDLDDGTQGLILIKQAGGTSVVQSPDDALHPSMPRHALRYDHVDHAAPISEMAALLSGLVRQRAGPTQSLTPDIVMEDAMAAEDAECVSVTSPSPGRPSVIGCPDCGGVLNELGDPESPRYRCQVGHAFTLLGLGSAQREETERALILAIRTQRDRSSVFLRLEQQAMARGHMLTGKRWLAAADEAKRLGVDLARALVQLEQPLPEESGT